MPLERELAFYEQHKAELLKHYEGQYVLIKGEKLVGVFSSEAEAYQAGVERFGLEPFLIKRVTREEEIEHVPALTLGILYARA